MSCLGSLNKNMIHYPKCAAYIVEVLLNICKEYN